MDEKQKCIILPFVLVIKANGVPEHETLLVCYLTEKEILKKNKSSNETPFKLVKICLKSCGIKYIKKPSLRNNDTPQELLV